MSRFLAFFWAMLLCFSWKTASSQISLDNTFEDWGNIQMVASEIPGDGFAQIGLTHNDDWLFVRLDLEEPVALDETIISHGTLMLIDVDDDSATGVDYAEQGLGVDILVDFPDRQVIRYTGGTGIESLNDLGLNIAPTYSAEKFELAIRRTDADLVNSDACRIMMYNTETQSGFPVGGIAVDFTPSVTPSFATPLEPHPSALLRVGFWNLNGRIGNAEAESAMAAMLAATHPDILGLSEVSNTSANAVRNKLNQWLPLPDGNEWHVVKDDWDLMVASQFPIVETHASVHRQFPVLIDVESLLGARMLFVSSHLKCCGGPNNEAQRQAEADEFMGFLRDGLNGDQSWPNPLPLVYGGDLNMVGLSNPIHTLVSGDIHDETTFGPDFVPDADGTDFTEWPIVQSDHPMDYTWENPESEWLPGKLDYIITSDASLDVVRSFVLNTAEMDGLRLDAYGLDAGTTLQASDHSLVIADLSAGVVVVEPADSDEDGVPDSLDNCMNIANANQNDFNNNGTGDACEDSDGDGLSDALEITTYGTDPTMVDTDENGVPDGLELCLCGPGSGDPCFGDLNSDNAVSVADLLIFLGVFGQPC
ncbi:MAG: endonuclease/exonuclease/phosphatase family protein [Flavobacteriales bacterium]